jgi:hypothetical protein
MKLSLVHFEMSLFAWKERQKLYWKQEAGILPAIRIRNLLSQ